MNKDKHTENHYRKLCEKLNEEIYLLEKIIKKKIQKLKSKKKGKLDPVGKEDADVDNDGKKNTKSDNYIKARREKIGQEMKKKKMVNEGYTVTDGNLFYGGFPRIMNEENGGVVGQFNDGDDKPGEPKIATMSDAQEYEALRDKYYNMRTAMNRRQIPNNNAALIAAQDAFLNHPYHKIAAANSAAVEKVMRAGGMGVD